VLFLAELAQFLTKKGNATIFLSDLILKFSVLALKDLKQGLGRFDLL